MLNALYNTTSQPAESSTHSVHTPGAMSSPCNFASSSVPAQLLRGSPLKEQAECTHLWDPTKQYDCGVYSFAVTRF